MKTSVAAKLLQYVLFVACALDILTTASLPFLLNTYSLWIYGGIITSRFFLFLLCFLMIFGLIGAWILVELILMIRSIATDPFVMRNAQALKRIGFLAIGAGLLFFGKCIWFPTPLTLICGLVFIVCALFSWTLCGLFSQAVHFKEENSLTI